MLASSIAESPSYLIKICGNKYAVDSYMVASYRPDFMGWIFSPKSPRQVGLGQIQSHLYDIKERYPQISHVAVFADNSIDEIIQIAQENIFDYLQVVAEPSFLLDLKTAIMRQKKQLGQQILPTVRVKETCLESSLISSYGDEIPFFILDSFVPGKPGGTGKSLQMQWINQIKTIPYLLAGGLKAENVSESLRLCHSCGVDVSSGLEPQGSFSPGHKEEAKLKAFMQAVRKEKAPLHVQLLIRKIRSKLSCAAQARSK